MPNSYIPKSIAYAVLRNAIVKDTVTGTEKEYPIVVPYCSLFKHTISNKKYILESSQLEFNGYKVVQSSSSSVSALLETDVGPLVLSERTLKSGEIAMQMLNKGFDKNFIDINFGFYSKFSGQKLYVAETSSETWKDILNSENIKEKPLKSSELEVGKVYGQLLKSKDSSWLYLGKIRDPSAGGKFSFCFIKCPYQYKIDSENYISFVEKALSNSIPYEEKDLDRWKRYNNDDRIKLMSSIPSNIIFDNGKFDFSNLSIEGLDLNSSNVQALVEDLISEQWIQYQIYIEYRKALGEYKKFGGSEKFKWKPPQPPVWLSWQRRVK